MDLKQLEAIAKREAHCKPFGAAVTLSVGERDALVALARDGMRYRYIRDVPWLESSLGDVISFQKNAVWDRAIDAAMACGDWQEYGESMKKTEWYPATVKPMHFGVYETYVDQSCQAFQYWNGRCWGLGSLTPESAFARKEIESAFQKVMWRGLANKPK